MVATRQATRTASRAKESLTVGTLVKIAHTRLRKAKVAFGHGTINAWDETVYLVLHALRLPLDQLEPVLSREVTPGERRRALKLVATRIRRRVPAAYLTHEAWLGDFRFYVDERVIVPRSFIAELLRERLAPWIAKPSRIKHALDLCTGSGCLAILLADTFRSAQVDAVDISSPALAVARRNVKAYHMQSRVHLVRSDMFKNIDARRYDLVVANPPYVRSTVMRRLPREYRQEPSLALAAGRDGLDFVRTILRDVPEHLNKNGLLVVEVGHNRRRVEAAFPHLPFLWLETSAGDDCVFMLARAELAQAAAVSPARHLSKRATVRSRPLRARDIGRA